MPYFKSFLLLLLIVSCQPQTQELDRVEGEALGTTYHISYFSDQSIDIEKSLDSIFDLVNGSMSTYQSDSDISRINRGEVDVKVDEMFREVFELSAQVYRESGGYFDPTVGDIVNLYGFGSEQGVTDPDSTMVDSLMKFVGMDKVELTDDGVLVKKYPEVYIEFNAIAKGYAIDAIGNFLDAQGVDNYLIELGGELLAKGKNLTKDTYWRVGVDAPQSDAEKREMIAVLELRNRAMATSGNYRKFRVDPETGTQYVHTINPLTGFPERGDLLSTTVLAPNCALADAYATAFMAMGYERAKALVEGLQDIDVFFLYLDQDGQKKEYLTSGLQEVIID